MSELSNEYIEDAFAQIRAKFEKSKNETGIEILDSYEEQWDATGSLSSRQHGWLKKQLDGSWKQKAKPIDKSENDVGAVVAQDNDIIQFPTVERDLERQIDAMISRKLGDTGTSVVDHKLLDELEVAIDGLRRAVRAMR